MGLSSFSLALAITSPAQTIDSISPDSGGIGTQITITGTSLYSSRDMNQLFIGGIETIPISWTNTQIVAVIPSGIPGNTTSIPIYTQYSNRYDDWASNTVLWTVEQAPIASITPTEGFPGDTVVLRGSGFGATRGTSFVTLDSKSAPVTFWNDTEIHVTVPLCAGSAGFVLHRAGLSPSTSSSFRVLPFIQSIDPPSGGVGTELQIHGQDLTPLDYQHIVYVNGSPTEASYWSSDLVIVTIRPGSIPPNALTAPIHIQYEWDDGEQSHWMGDTNAFQYPVSQASITSLVPSSGRPTQAIQINGSHFGDLQNQSTVTLSGVPAEVVSWSDSRITALIPEGAPTGYISVNVPGIGAGTSWFSVLPWLKSSSPAIAAPGNIMTLTGQDLVSYYDVRELLVNGVEVPAITWTDSQISFVVPSSAAGSITVQARYMVGNDYDGYFETDFSNSLVIPVQLPVSLVLNSVSPTSGYPGDIVTLGGAGFGATQGASTVTFNGATAEPISWNDSQIQVPVPFGATTGPITLTVGSTTVQSATFSVLSPPSVTGFSPTSGPVGTEIVISGTNFGAPTAESAVLLGGITLPILNWSDLSIRASIPETADTGMVSVHVGPFIMDVGTFTVTGKTTGPEITLSPDQVSLVVDESRTLDAFDSDGNVVTGLRWSSSDTNIVSLSTDDPPVLTALAPGTATITAGTGTAEITVYPGPELPEGTVKWKVPDDGSGLWYMIPAVPSPDGVADVFSVSNSGSVQAIAADGHVAWRAPLAGRLIPDFQGGYIDAARNSVQKRDGLTGQAHPAYVSSWSNSPVVVHTDGTVFQFDNYSLVAIDPLTGRPKFTVPMQIGTYGAWYQSLIIAGDGYAYALYGVDSGTGSTESKQTKDPASGEITYTETTSTWQYQTQYRVLRVGIDNSSRDIPLHTYTDSGYSKNTDTKVISRYDENGNPVYKHVYHREERETGSSFVDYEAAMITNADQGVLLSWRDISVPDYQYSHDWDSEGHELGKTETSGEATFPWRLTAISGGEITSDATINLAYDRDTPQPVLQKEDGTFLGYQEQDSNQLMAFDASGNIKWSFPTDPNGWAEPLYALADGGMIYRQYTDYRNGTYHTQKLITLDDKGNESKRETDEGLTLSWKGAYKPGSTKSVVKDMLRLVLSFGAAKNGNVTGNSTAVKHRSLRMFWCGSNICKASDGTGKDVTFSYSPVGSNKTPIDFSGLHPEWVGQIMAQALYSLKQAFARYPVSVFLGNDGNRALVTGDYPAAQSGSIPCADTFSGSHVSAVYYLVNMEEAQHASSLSPNFPPVTPEDLKYFGTLIRAIGTGIGNNTAHEFAHQLNIKGMDQHTDSDAYDFFSCVGYPDSTNGSPALYTGIGKDGKTLIHWGKIASEDLNKVLLK